MKEQITVYYDNDNKATDEIKNDVADFLFDHLERFGDPREDIMKSINYAMAENGKPGGCILVMRHDNEIVGAVVINKTGMEGYIPENILVYIATHRDKRGQGLGRKLMNKTAEVVDGDIKLHVEADNPAKYLYEKVGYENKYLEMRFKNK